MIVLDTHIWVWWVQDDQRLTAVQRQAIQAQEADVLGVSAISCWEVAKLVERGRLKFSIPLETWFEKALSYPGVQLLAITPEIAIASTRLPGEFHRDPADQLIVATARSHGCGLITSDARIIDYAHVETVQ
jgi:PIN domain nuclease of toxin-antitoxin system